MSKIDVQGTKITVLEGNFSDYISLTDMTGVHEEGSRLVEKWISNKNTLEFLGVWEGLNNSNFNSPEFEGIKSASGTNRFTMSVKKWIEKTQAIGLMAKSGRYGGTFAHKDIAFEFGSWLSPLFKLLLIKEFQRLKEEEQKRLHQGWDVKRFLSKANYKIHTEAVKQYLLPISNLSKDKSWLVYAEEADIINMALFGKTAKQWREENSTLILNGINNMRDMAETQQLIVLANIENYNAILIKEGIDKEERFLRLRSLAIEQLNILGGTVTEKLS